MNLNKIQELVKKYYKYVVGVILVPIIIIISVVNVKGRNVVIDEFKDELSFVKDEVKEDIKSEPEYVMFDVKGAVKNPGAYKLESDKRVYDAIRISGGLKVGANTTLINLSKKLTDEMVIIVHTDEEIREMNKKEPVIQYIEKECSYPNVKNDASVDNEKESDKNKLPSLVSINKATMEELMTLPGIGEAKAKGIIQYRDENNGFDKIDDLLNVSGIGTKAFEALKDFITI